MIDAISTGLSAVLGWFGQVVKSIFAPAATGTTNGVLAELLPAIGIGVALTLVFAGVNLVKSVIKGY